MKSTNADFTDDAFGITGNKGGSAAEEEEEDEEDEEEGDVTADAEYADAEPLRNVRFFFKKVTLPLPRNVCCDTKDDVKHEGEDAFGRI